MTQDSIAGEPKGTPSRNNSRHHTTAQQIKEFILTNHLHPGDPLPTESEFCHQLGVSRSSVREAVKTLVTLGIVEVRHGHGTFVGPMSLEALVETLVFRGALMPGDDLRALREVVEIRQALDLAMAERLTAGVAGTTSPHLWDLVARMVDTSKKGETFAEEDRAFHTELLGRMENSLMAPLVGAFWDIHMAVLPRLGVSLPADLAQTAQAHADMLQAAEDGDAVAYRASVLRHYEPLMRALEAAKARGARETMR